MKLVMSLSFIAKLTLSKKRGSRSIIQTLVLFFPRDRAAGVNKISEHNATKISSAPSHPISLVQLKREKRNMRNPSDIIILEVKSAPLIW